MSSENKKNTVGIILSWFFGIFLIIVGLVTPTNQGFLHLFILGFTGLFLLPPINQWLEKTLNITFSGGVKTSIVILVFTINRAILFYGVTSQPLSNQNRNTAGEPQIQKSSINTPSAISETNSPITFGKPTVKSSAMDTLIYVEVKNNEDSKISCSVNAVFKKGDTILGNASGAVNEIPPHGSRTATLMMLERPKGYDTIKLEPGACF